MIHKIDYSMKNGVPYLRAYANHIWYYLADMLTVECIGNALTAYGKNAEDAEEFLNILTAAQNNSATSLEQLLTAYVDLAGTFNTLHVGFEESATLMGQMANAGIKGSEAGTALNSVILRLL